MSMNEATAELKPINFSRTLPFRLLNPSAIQMAENFSSFSKVLLKAKTEEEVKHACAQHIGLGIITSTDLF